MRIHFYFDTKGSIVEHQIDAPVFAVTGFERGFSPIHTRSNAAKLNDDGLTAEVLESALCGSVAGWHTPAAAAARAYIEAQERGSAMAEERERLEAANKTLAEALEVAVATVELNTGNGAQSQPAWPLDKGGNVDYEAVAKLGRDALATVGR